MGKCKTENCNKDAYYGYEEKKGIACADHRIKPEMKDVMRTKCKTCKKTTPSYGIEIGKPTHCNKCKSDIMFNVKSKMCEVCKKKQPFFGIT